MGDSFLHQILIAGYTGKLFEQSGKMKFGKTGQICQVINIYVFGTVVGDIFADIHEFFNVFMLLAGSYAGELFTGIKIGASNGHKETDHQGIDQCFREGHFIVIFTADLVQIGAKLCTELWIFIMFDQSIRVERLDQGIRSVLTAYQAIVKQHDKPFARICAGRSNQMM